MQLQNPSVRRKLSAAAQVRSFTVASIPNGQHRLGAATRHRANVRRSAEKNGADSGPELWGLQEELLKEIEERKRNQAQLLQRLNKIGEPAAAAKQQNAAPATQAAPAPATAAVQAPIPEKKEPLAGPNVMNIVMVGAECAPWSKTGGLGDVMGALPKALARRGHRVMVVAPRYGNYDDAWETGVRCKFRVFNSDQEVGFFHAYQDGVDYLFVDHSCFHGRSGGEIYTGDRASIQFRCALLCKAALESVWHVPCGGVVYGDSNCVFIANDWHTALLPVYLQAHYRDYNKMTFARSVFVIHNIAHQGRAPFDEVHNLEVPESYKENFRLYDPVGGEHMNVMKAGFQNAHRIIAVSHGYAWECQTQEGGWGLDGILRDNSWKLRGIVNGIDYNEWSPQKDVHLRSDGYVNYDITTMEKKKAQCKGWVGFSTAMAHRITAGCDMLLMPSRFEPCGLNQLYAMAYGTVPIVHAVGGLRDTVSPFNPYDNTGTGWTFDRAEGEPLRHALYNAMETYRHHPDSFRAIARRGMEQDLSWDHAAEMYEQVLVDAKYQW